jgi:hypothetical protein
LLSLMSRQRVNSGTCSRIRRNPTADHPRIIPDVDHLIRRVADRGEKSKRRWHCDGVLPNSDHRTADAKRQTSARS